MSILKGKASDGIEKLSKEKKSKSKDLKQVPNGKADSVAKNKKDKKEKVKKLPPVKQPSSSEDSSSDEDEDDKATRYNHFTGF